MLVRRLAPLVALGCLAVATAAPAATDAFAARITKETVVGHRATFRFKAVNGTATGFFCTFYSETSKNPPPATPCGSPMHYTRLARNTYTFDVYAVGPLGDSIDASRTFSIP